MSGCQVKTLDSPMNLIFDIKKLYVLGIVFFGLSNDMLLVVENPL